MENENEKKLPLNNLEDSSALQKQIEDAERKSNEALNENDTALKRAADKAKQAKEGFNNSIKQNMYHLVAMFFVWISASAERAFEAGDIKKILTYGFIAMIAYVIFLDLHKRKIFENPEEIKRKIFDEPEEVKESFVQKLLNGTRQYRKKL